MMPYIMLGMWVVALALVTHMMINLNWKTGDWKGRYKGKALPF
jgi:hypothetical protein